MFGVWFYDYLFNLSLYSQAVAGTDFFSRCGGDVITVLFTFLHLGDHIRLGRTFKFLRDAAGILPCPTKSDMPPDKSWIRPAVWRKPVTPPKSVKDEELHRLLRFARPTSLHLGYCWDITDQGLLRLQNLPLQYLDLSCCKITDVALGYLQQLLQLQRLNLKGCKAITYNCLVHLKDLPLQYLDLSDCPNVGLGHLQQLVKLQRLELKGCKAITDEGLVHLKNLPLQHLNLESCRISDDGLAHLQSLTQLRHLSLAYCYRTITIDGLVKLGQLPQLKYLDVTGPRRMSRREIYVGKKNILRFLDKLN